MATTRAVLRQRLVELAYGQFYQIDTTSAGSTTTAVSTAFADLIGGGDADFFENWYILITETGHAAINEFRRCSTYDGVSTATLARAFGATTGSGTQIEVLPWSPDLLHACINSAGRRLYPSIYLPRLDETLVTNQLGTNMDFETFAAGSFTGWTNDTGPTIAQETTRVFHGSNSASITGGTSADLGVFQDLTVNVADIVGRSITFGGLAWTTTASAGRLTINFGGAASPNARSPYHTGDEDWEEIFITTAIPSDATRIRLICGVIATGAPLVYFDSMYCYIMPIDRYALPTAFIDPPDRLSIATERKNPLWTYQPNTNWVIERDGETDYIRFHERLPSGYRMRLEGRAALTLPATDSASMEIEDNRIDVVVELAAGELFKRLAAGSGGQDSQELVSKSQMHFNTAMNLLAMPGVKRAQGTNLRYPTR